MQDTSGPVPLFINPYYSNVPLYLNDFQFFTTITAEVLLSTEHWVKSVHIRRYSGPYLQKKKYGTEKLRIRTIFVQWK